MSWMKNNYLNPMTQCIKLRIEERVQKGRLLLIPDLLYRQERELHQITLIQQDTTITGSILLIRALWTVVLFYRNVNFGNIDLYVHL